MSIQSQIDRISGNINAAFSVLRNRGANIPANAASKDLAEAINSEVVPVANGGTGASDAAEARVNLGVDISEETIQMFEDAGYPIEE